MKEDQVEHKQVQETEEQIASQKRMRVLQIKIANALKESHEENIKTGNGEMTVFETHQVFIGNMLKYNKFGLRIQNKME